MEGNPRTQGYKNRRTIGSKVQSVKDEETKNVQKTALASKVVNPLYTCPRAPFYREKKRLLHSENTLESKEYS
jgi:hypothetical protein